MTASAKRLQNFRHEFFEAVGVFEFSAEGIRCILRAFGNNEDGVAVGFDELFGELIPAENIFDMVEPAVKMDDEVNGFSLVEFFRDEDGNGAIGAVFISGIIFSL